MRPVDTSWSLRELNEAVKQGTELIYNLREETALAAGKRLTGSGRKATLGN